jgi:hypothetical protein
MSVNNNLQTGPGRVRIATFTASGTWTAPAGVYSVNVLGVGGGGAGGNAQFTGLGTSNSVKASGGGGGGGGVFDGIVPVVPGTSYTVTIGSSGISAAAITAGGGSGGNTSFGSLITCPGGQGGVSQAAGTAVTAGRSPGYASTNPGGSWGGHGFCGDFFQGSFGGGAASKPHIIMKPNDSVATAYTNNSHSVFTVSYNNGYGVVQVPYVNIDTNHTTTGSTNGNLSSVQWNTSSSTLNLPYIKRNRSQGLIPRINGGITVAGGASWKGLGAGGGSMNVSLQGNYYRTDPWLDFIDPSAGYNSITTTSYGATAPTSGTVFNGTSAAGNSGAGGGGAYTPDLVGAALGAGGNGGSGYLEVTWVE